MIQLDYPDRLAREFTAGSRRAARPSSTWPRPITTLCRAEHTAPRFRAEIAFLNRRFDPDAPNQIWVTDITMIRTHEGWLYVCVVLDLFSRAVVGWSMQSRVHADLTLKALLMAVWRRKPAPGLLVHSDQGSQFTGDDWQRFLAAHDMECSMSRRGNCHDNAVAESFFQLLKRERVKRRIYNTRDEARADVFD